MVALIGAVPDWLKGYGYGDGDGYGSGYGYGDGYGYGYGYGDGYGYGSGYGDGSGYGSGYGDGSGDGSGYGDGSGDGDGDGDGSGYGYGYGDGSGDGDGDGDGDGSYWSATIPYFAAKWPADQQARLDTLEASGAKIMFWRSDAKGRAANGGDCEPVTIGTVHREKGPLRMCSRGTLHATLIPPKWQGERWWIVAMIGEVQGDDVKYGALEREIIGECL